MNAITNSSSSERKLLAQVATRPGVAGMSSPEARHDLNTTQRYTVEEIQARTETMTPLLKEILDFHPTIQWQEI